MPTATEGLCPKAWTERPREAAVAAIGRRWYFYYLASRQPIPDRSAADLAKRMPASAAADLVEWGPFPTAEQQFAAVLRSEVPVNLFLATDKDVPAMQDDRPVNEYSVLRHVGDWLHF